MISDKVLVEQAQNGSKSAMSELINKYQHKITKRVYKYVKNWDDAEDIAQISSIDAYTKINSFQGRSAFLTWYTRIAIYNALKAIRSSKCRPPRQDKNIDEEEQLNLVAHSETPEAMAELDDLEDVFRDAIDTMNSEQARVVWLRESKGMTYDQIAEYLKVPTGTIRSQMNRGRNHLKSCLKGAQA